MPHPPQTDGLSERFNQTLKCMLRILITSTGSGWDKWPALTLLPPGNYHRHKQDLQRLNLTLDSKHRVPFVIIKEGKTKNHHDEVGQVYIAEEKQETQALIRSNPPDFFCFLILWFFACAGHATTKVSDKGKFSLDPTFKAQWALAHLIFNEYIK